MTEYIVTPFQTLTDIAIEVYGDVTGIFSLLEDNPELAGLDADLQAGEVLLIRAEVINPAVAQFFKNRGLRITSSEYEVPQEPDEEDLYSSDEILLISSDEIVLKSS